METLELIPTPLRQLQTRASFPEASPVLQEVQIADELGFAYLVGDIDFGAVGRDEIFQNIRFIILTEYFSTPLDREFGFDYSMIDKPMAIAEAIFAQEVALKISLYEPRAQFRSIDYVRDELIGKLAPSVVVALLTTQELPSTMPQSGEVFIAGTPGGTTIEPIDLPGFYESLIEMARVPGPEGPVGLQGDAATIEVGTTTTGAPGTDAEVSNSGTMSQAVFDFVIPQGEKGDQGVGVTIKGTVPTKNSLPTTGNTIGDMWIASDTGHGWSWDGAVWVDVGPIQGPPGATGPTGATGPEGPPAQIWRGAYSPTMTYYDNDAVSYQGSTFICTGTTTGIAPAPNTASWIIPPIATTAYQGAVPALSPSNQTSLYARGDNTWQNLATAVKTLAIHLPPFYFKGFGLGNDAGDATNDIKIAPGQCRDETDVENIVNKSSVVKQLDALWAAGTNAGGRDTGAIADAWWHVFAIMNPTTGAVDYIFAKATTNVVPTPVMPSGFTLRRRIGAVQRTGGALRSFRNYGDLFQWFTPILDANGGTVATSSSLNQGLGSVPLGCKMELNFNARLINTTTVVGIEFSDPDSTSGGGSGSLYNPAANINAAGNFTLMTNSSASIRVSHAGGAAAATYYMSVQWYRERRDI